MSQILKIANAQDGGMFATVVDDNGEIHRARSIITDLGGINYGFTFLVDGEEKKNLVCMKEFTGFHFRRLCKVMI